VARGQIVQHHHQVTLVLQGANGVTADVARTTGDEHPSHDQRPCDSAASYITLATEG
jgi:hypothetical protein